MSTAPAYSMENGLHFAWSSLTGDLALERVSLLREHLCGEEILDAGCGGGAFAEFLAAQGRRVTGLDYHAMFLDVARGRPGARGTYVEGDITALPFPDASFDCAYCFDVLEHVDDARALAELVRVTRRRLILAVPATDEDQLGHGMTFHHYRDLTHLRTYTRASLGALLEAAGQRQFTIRPELPIDLHGAASAHLRSERTAHPARAARSLYHAVLRRLLRHARYPVIHTGWTAVVDLPPAGAAPHRP